MFSPEEEYLIGGHDNYDPTPAKVSELGYTIRTTDWHKVEKEEQDDDQVWEL